MVNIKVAVRIRPFSQRELSQRDDSIVRTEGKAILVTNPKIPEKQDGDSRQRTRKFVADFCYDPNDPDTCSQEAVYEEVGKEVLDSMFEGYNACVLAYGHSASGKTYTMMGLPDDPGLTPRICQGLFDRIQNKYGDRIRFHILISFLEIYNEKVRDLLVSDDAGGSSGNFSLRVREHPKLGPYVQDLSHHLVTDKKKLLQFLDIGSRRRSTAATENNIHSSRSHAVFTIQFKQSDEESYETDKSSKVHLVDLAGSERASSAQSKTRLKEGANINKSLVTLGNVISALAESYETSAFLKEHSSSRTWQPFVPYRDSVLTWLLKDTLGGNSNTIMIATISPGSSCLSETINTLRYARRTKRIVNQPIINEDPKIRTIRELREEIARLKHLLLSYQPHPKEDSTEDLTEYSRSDFEELLKFESTISKWVDSGGRKLTDCQDCAKKNILNKSTFESKEVNNNEKVKNEIDKGQNLDILESTSSKGEKELEAEVGEEVGEEEEEEENAHIFCGIPRAASLGGDACKINDEKKSDVNGSVIDNPPHETQFFSDSLESFSSLPSKRNADADKGGKCAVSKSDKKLRLCLKREFSSCENLATKDFSKMLHRSRPDLIKGIATRSKDGIPSTSSQSCTDVSNSSKSTSDNSLNSSGSVDMQTTDKRRSVIEKSSMTQLSRGKPELTQRRGSRGESSQPGVKKKEKRSEIVEAVTSRLYISKKKSDPKMEIAEKVEGGSSSGFGVIVGGGVGGEDGGEFEDLKLCKRARMKLFDLSRKLAMARKIKKTVDNDTQTDFQTGTIRMKEKCVVTDQSGVLSFENCGTNTNPDEILPDPNKCVIMNQVFIPRSSNYVVECGKVVRIEVPDTNTQDLGTQTIVEKTYKNVNTSPIKFNPEMEDSFSDDSLDSDEKSNLNGKIYKKDKSRWDDDLINDSKRLCQNPIRRSYDSLIDSRSGQNCFAQTKNDKSFSYECLNPNKIPKTLTKDPMPLVMLTGSGSSSKREGNFSSENSFTSIESVDVGTSSETSSEDFVFYETPKDPPPNKPSDRELYTITENSEQSETSDGFSPVNSQMSSLSPLEEGKSSQEPEAAEKFGADVQERFKTGCSQTERRSNGNLDNPSLINMFTSRSQNLQVPISSFYPAYNRSFPENVPKYSDAETSTDTNFLKAKKVSWKSFNNSPQKFVNFNILNSSKQSPFSIDIGEPSKKDQSTEAMFTSQDSITFVFMGPAKPKTSVLMELIRRSLNKGEVDSPQASSTSRGVQCDSGLMRSVSVDSAMLALSKIAKNQNPINPISKTISLDTLTSDELPSNLNRENLFEMRETSCQCDLDGESAKQTKKSVLKYSISTNTTRDQVTETIKTSEEYEKPKKTVSWSGETKSESLEDIKDAESPSFDLNYCDSSEVEVEEPNEDNFSSLESYQNSDSIPRRVRFSNPDSDYAANNSHKKEASEMSSFLKEATQLLRNINYHTGPRGLSLENPFKVKSHENEDLKKSFSKLLSNEVKVAQDAPPRRSKALLNLGDINNEEPQNLTWPRRRPSNGKPPSGLRSSPSPRFSRSPIPPRSNSSYSNGFPELTKNYSQGSRVGSSSTNWNLSNLSVTFSNSWVGSRASSSRSIHSNPRAFSATPPRMESPKPLDAKLNFTSIIDIEADLEESCRRLELAVEQDRLRQENLRSEHIKYTSDSTEYSEDESCVDKRLWSVCSEPVKRRKTVECVDACHCRKETLPCKHLWQKTCRSSFELDSFGPGSNHCHQLCMFCRKKETEIYSSSPNLNSVCDYTRCRLNFYGYCPCSPVRIKHVAGSPRAYMQHLLSLRRHIVNSSKYGEI